VKYLIDSNIWIYAASGIEPAIDVLDEASRGEWAGFSAICRLEVLGYPDLTVSDEQKLCELLECFREVEIGRSVIDRAIALRRTQRIKVPDAIVAGTALLMGASLITRNSSDFTAVKGLNVINPFEAKPS